MGEQGGGEPSPRPKCAMRVSRGPHESLLGPEGHRSSINMLGNQAKQNYFSELFGEQVLSFIWPQSKKTLDLMFPSEFGRHTNLCERRKGR